MWWAVAVSALFSSASSAQEIRANDKFPHPFIYAGIQLNGGGYAPLSQVVGAGLEHDAARFFSIAEFSYDNARKSNDGTVNNRNGHDRHASARFFYRLPAGYFVGAGYQWNQLTTTNYVKSASRPAFGGGKDWIRENFSARFQGIYVLPGSDRQNALQGPELQFWLPSPATRHHFFFRTKLGIYGFHDTVTDPTDRLLTAQQMSRRSYATWVEYTLCVKF